LDPFSNLFRADISCLAILEIATNPPPPFWHRSEARFSPCLLLLRCLSLLTYFLYATGDFPIARFHPVPPLTKILLQVFTHSPAAILTLPGSLFLNTPLGFLPFPLDLGFISLSRDALPLQFLYLFTGPLPVVFMSLCGLFPSSASHLYFEMQSPTRALPAGFQMAGAVSLVNQPPGHPVFLFRLGPDAPFSFSFFYLSADDGFYA